MFWLRNAKDNYFVTHSELKAWFQICRPLEFLNCSEPQDRKENETVDVETGRKYGCSKVSFFNSLCTTDFFLLV